MNFRLCLDLFYIRIVRECFGERLGVSPPSLIILFSTDGNSTKPPRRADALPLACQ